MQINNKNFYIKNKKGLLCFSSLTKEKLYTKQNFNSSYSSFAKLSNYSSSKQTENSISSIPFFCINKELILTSSRMENLANKLKIKQSINSIKINNKFNYANSWIYIQRLFLITSLPRKDKHNSISPFYFQDKQNTGKVKISTLNNQLNKLPDNTVKENNIESAFAKGKLNHVNKYLNNNNKEYIYMGNKLNFINFFSNLYNINYKKSIEIDNKSISLLPGMSNNYYSKHQNVPILNKYINFLRDYITINSALNTTYSGINKNNEIMPIVHNNIQISEIKINTYKFLKNNLFIFKLKQRVLKQKKKLINQGRKKPVSVINYSFYSSNTPTIVNLQLKLNKISGLANILFNNKKNNLECVRPFLDTINYSNNSLESYSNKSIKYKKNNIFPWQKEKYAEQEILGVKVKDTFSYLFQPDPNEPVYSSPDKKNSNAASNFINKLHKIKLSSKSGSEQKEVHNKNARSNKISIKSTQFKEEEFKVSDGKFKLSMAHAQSNLNTDVRSNKIQPSINLKNKFIFNLIGKVNKKNEVSTFSTTGKMSQPVNLSKNILRGADSLRNTNTAEKKNISIQKTIDNNKSLVTHVDGNYKKNNKYSIYKYYPIYTNTNSITSPSIFINQWENKTWDITAKKEDAKLITSIFTNRKKMIPMHVNTTSHIKKIILFENSQIQVKSPITLFEPKKEWEKKKNNALSRNVRNKKRINKSNRPFMLPNSWSPFLSSLAKGTSSLTPLEYKHKNMCISENNNDYNNYISLGVDKSKFMLNKYFNKWEAKKSLNDIFKLLSSYFKSMSCLISNPIFIITPNKIKIQLFYFLFIPLIFKSASKKNFISILQNHAKPHKSDVLRVVNSDNARVNENKNVITKNTLHINMKGLVYSNETGGNKLLKQESIIENVRSNQFKSSLNSVKNLTLSSSLLRGDRIEKGSNSYKKNLFHWINNKRSKIFTNNYASYVSNNINKMKEPKYIRKFNTGNFIALESDKVKDMNQMLKEVQIKQSLNKSGETVQTTSLNTYQTGTNKFIKKFIKFRRLSLNRISRWNIWANNKKISRGPLANSKLYHLKYSSVQLKMKTSNGVSDHIGKKNKLVKSNGRILSNKIIIGKNMRSKKKKMRFFNLKLKLKIRMAKLTYLNLIKFNPVQAKFRRLTDILSYFFQKSIELDLIRMHYPYNNPKILINFMAFLINKKRVQILIRKTIRGIMFKNIKRVLDINNKVKLFDEVSLDNKRQSKDFQFKNSNLKNMSLIKANDAEGIDFPGEKEKYASNENIKLKKKNNNNAFLTGITFRAAGRLKTQRIVPRYTTYSKVYGFYSPGRVDFIDFARYTNKSKRGSFSISIHMAHKLFLTGILG